MARSNLWAADHPGAQVARRTADPAAAEHRLLGWKKPAWKPNDFDEAIATNPDAVMLRIQKERMNAAYFLRRNTPSQ